MIIYIWVIVFVGCLNIWIDQISPTYSMFCVVAVCSLTMIVWYTWTKDDAGA